MTRRSGLTAALVAVLVLCVKGEQARATTIDTRHKPALLLGKARQVLAISGWDCLATYSIKDGTLLHRFHAGGAVHSLIGLEFGEGEGCEQENRRQRKEGGHDPP
jgi:hypothetical protein